VLLKKEFPDDKINRNEDGWNVVHTGGGEIRGGLLWGNPRGRNRLQDLVIDGRLILKRI
jgi:hypothetical protein